MNSKHDYFLMAMSGDLSKRFNRWDLTDKDG